MIDATQYVQSVERDLRHIRTISEQLCKNFFCLPIESQRAFARAVAFAGCKSISTPSRINDAQIQEADRIWAARLMLLKMSVDTGEPRWSSWVLERMLEAVMTTPGGSVNDVFRALFEVLGEFAPELTGTMANFLKEITIQCFTRYRESYESADFAWISQSVNERPTNAQAYLALYAMPERILPKCREAILRALATTAFRGEAIRNLENDGVQ